jgi:penicillin-binding protein 1A
MAEAARRLRASIAPTMERIDAGLKRAAGQLRSSAPSRPQSIAIAVVIVVGIWAAWARCGFAGCPAVTGLAVYRPEGASVLLDRRGVAFADLAPFDYEVVPLDSLPDYVSAAFIAVEDKRFVEHDGVDWVRVVGALWANIRAGGAAEGSSTISMQLARTLFPDLIRREEKTLRRKIIEARVAGEIEERLTKDEILELYINHIYLGGGAHGVQAASRYYFGKDARDLRLEEAALIAALPKAPSHFDPWRNPDAARARRDLVLALMAEQGLVSKTEALNARRREIAVVDEAIGNPDGDRPAPWFVERVRALLEPVIGDLYEEPLRITTTLDLRMQNAAEAELSAQLEAVEAGTYGRLRAPAYERAADPESTGTDYLQGAVVFMDAHSGDILAWVGGRDFDHSRFDRAAHARRQAGSAFKPFIYAAALEVGISPSQPILDAPFSFTTVAGRIWEPRNYSGLFEGPLSMRQALVQSQNVPAVRLAAAIGGGPIADLARRAGIEGDVPASPVAALGVTAVSPIELAAAYSAFAGLGTRVTPRAVLRVEDAAGRVLHETRPERIPVLDTTVAYIIADMLRDVVNRGTGWAVRTAFRGPAAGKTGTTSDVTDVWFAGFTRDIVGTVWIGFDDQRALPGRATGGRVAAPVWGSIAAAAYEDRAITDWWDRPPQIVNLPVDPETGLVLQQNCRPVYDDEPARELFVRGAQPRSVCPRRRSDNVFGQIAGWVGTVFRTRAQPWLRDDADPDLGMPRVQLHGSNGRTH